jgi:hypothetical protein
VETGSKKSNGIFFPFDVLHFTHAQTRLDSLSSPPTSNRNHMINCCAVLSSTVSADALISGNDALSIFFHLS